MTEADALARRFEEHRGRLRAVAYRMLGSLSEADDAVQESWLRLSRTGAAGIDNLGGWLTTVVGRICLDMLRTRTSRREEPLDVHVPDPVVSPIGGGDPEYEAMVSDAVGLALLVVLDTLTPAERLAFVLHDMFAVPFDEIARVLDRSLDAAKQLASRGRRRVRGAEPAREHDPARQRQVVEAFLAASRAGDFERLLAVLDPDVVLRADLGAAGGSLVRGAAPLALQARAFSPLAFVTRVVLVNGAPGLLSIRDGQPFSIMAFTVRDARVVRLDVLADADRLARLPLPAPE